MLKQTLVVLTVFTASGNVACERNTPTPMREGTDVANAMDQGTTSNGTGTTGAETTGNGSPTAGGSAAGGTSNVGPGRGGAGGFGGMGGTNTATVQAGSGAR